MIEFLTIAACALTALAAIIGLVLLLNEKGPPRGNERVKDKEDDNYPTTLTSSGAIDRWIELSSEFDALVTEIAHSQARAAGKEVTFAEAKAGVPKEKTISSEDMDVAFLEAVNELQIETSIVYRSSHSDCEVKKSLLEKIQKLRKKYEKQTP